MCLCSLSMVCVYMCVCMRVHVCMRSVDLPGLTYVGLKKKS